ncbi:MAG: stage III sporulation protein AF [Clostridia bacterium]|nr:stage III sporulation protein AF [Clostridia bacterium]
MDFITSWVQGIIIAVIIGSIIEMLLPNGNSKKYIKVVIGVYIVFSIVSPIISKFTGSELKLESIIDINKYEEKIASYEIDTKNLENTNKYNIKEVYILNLKKDIKAKIEDKGYIVNSIQIEIENTDEYKVKNINMTLSKRENKKEETEEKSINEIEKVNIEVKIENSTTEEPSEMIRLTTKEINEIKEYISSVYEIDKKDININKI